MVRVIGFCEEQFELKEDKPLKMKVEGSYKSGENTIAVDTGVLKIEQSSV